MYRSIWVLSIFLLLAVIPLAPVAADEASICANAQGDEAIAACSGIIESGKTSERELAVIYRNRAVALRIKGDHDRAIADYNKAIRLDPKYVNALINRGISYRIK